MYYSSFKHLKSPTENTKLEASHKILKETFDELDLMYGNFVKLLFDKKIRKFYNKESEYYDDKTKQVVTGDYIFVLDTRGVYRINNEYEIVLQYQVGRIPFINNRKPTELDYKYNIGDLWIENDSGNLYICVQNIENKAIWQNVIDNSLISKYKFGKKILFPYLEYIKVKSNGTYFIMKTNVVTDLPSKIIEIYDLNDNFLGTYHLSDQSDVGFVLPISSKEFGEYSRIIQQKILKSLVYYYNSLDIVKNVNIFTDLVSNENYPFGYDDIINENYYFEIDDILLHICNECKLTANVVNGKKTLEVIDKPLDECFECVDFEVLKLKKSEWEGETIKYPFVKEIYIEDSNINNIPVKNNLEVLSLKEMDLNDSIKQYINEVDIKHLYLNLIGLTYFVTDKFYHTLDLSDNDISVYEIKEVENLFLKRNSIAKFDDKYIPNRVRHIDVSNNQISGDIIIYLEHNNLKRLNLSNNFITYFSFKSQYLEELDLSYNYISDITFLNDLPNLRILNIKGNQEVPQEQIDAFKDRVQIIH